MANYGLVETINGKETITQVSSDPTKQFHEDLAKIFVSVSASAKSGWVKNGSKWEAPADIPDPTPDTNSMVHTQCVTKSLFFLEMTRAERTAYKAAVKAGTSDTVNDLEDIFQNSGDVWLLDHAQNEQGKDVLANLKAEGILTDATITKLTTIHQLDKVPPGVG